MSFISKDSVVQQRELLVQEIAVPIKIVGNATPASVVPTTDEPSMVFMKTAGVDQITAALADGETATYTVSPADATGIFNVLIKVKEPVKKIMAAMIVGRDSGLVEVAKLGDADGLTSLGNMMITCDSAKDLTSATLDACLIVKYII